MSPPDEPRRRRKLRTIVLAVGLVLAAVGAIVGYLSLPDQRSGLDGTLTIGHLFPIDSLNPFIGLSNEAYLFYALVYDYLFSVDEDGLTYVPNIAESATYQVTANGTPAWVYQIREGVKWHDGSSLTAEDVTFTVNYNIQAFYQLWAYQPYVNQVKPCPRLEKVECGAAVTGPSEVTVYFTRPFSPGGSAMVFPIIQKRQWETITASDAQSSYPNPTPIGTGPFKADPDLYDQWRNERPLVLHRNPDYHFEAPLIEKIVFSRFRDENSMVLAFLRGDIDAVMMSAAGFDAVRQSRDRTPAVNATIEQQEGPTSIHYWIDVGITQVNDAGPNRRLNPARFDLNVRQAMAHATNKGEIVQQFYRGKGIVGSTVMSPVSPTWHYEPTTEKFDFNVTKAGEILDQAGYRDLDGDGVREAVQDIILDVYCSPENTALTFGQCQNWVTVPKGTRLTFSMVTRVEAPEERLIAEYLKQTWSQVGIQLCGHTNPNEAYSCADPNIVVEEEIPAMTPHVYGGWFDTYIWWWSGDADPNYILSIQSNTTLNGWNDNYFDNRTYNELYFKHLEAFDLTERQRFVREAQSVHYRAANFIILVYPFFEYAWWTDEFDGWGDMNANPGRQIGAFWGKHPLFLSLRPKAAGSQAQVYLSVGLFFIAQIASATRAGSPASSEARGTQEILEGRRNRSRRRSVS